MLIKDILNVCNGTLICGDENTELTNFEKDTRKIKKGDTFIALIGQNFDGNDFALEALNNGASTCIASKKLPAVEGKNIIFVKDTLLALQQIASYKREQSKIPVVAITGSVGKTSTKDMVASVLSQKFKVLKTEGNLNNDIGLPMTILKLKDEEIMVVEMGMNHFGEIRKLTKIAKPNLAVITNIGTAHIGNLGSRENILKAKLEILEGLQPGGAIVINNDNDLLQKWVREDKEYKKITYGITNKNSDYTAENIEFYEDKTTYQLNTIKEKEVSVPVGGEHFVLNSLCAIAVGRYFNMNYDQIIKGIANLNLTGRRMELIKTKMGTVIINDAYNANYDSMTAALNYLKRVSNKRKIAVLGDMLELGEYSEKIHKKVGEETDGIDILITVGSEAKNIARTSKASKTLCYENNQNAINEIEKIMDKNDIILVKASNGMRFDKIIDQLVSFANKN